jgi:hypothetical protein
MVFDSPLQSESALNYEWIKNLRDIVTRVEFEPFREKADPKEAAGIPDHLDHDFQTALCVAPFQNLFVLVYSFIPYGS